MKQVLIYDIEAVPMNMGLTAAKVIEIYNEQGIVLWSSVGDDPKVVPIEPKVVNIPENTVIKIIDIGTEEGLKIAKTYLNETPTPGTDTGILQSP